MFLKYPHTKNKKCSVAFDEIEILPDFKGISVHDFWKPYEKYNCSHTYCSFNQGVDLCSRESKTEMGFKND